MSETTAYERLLRLHEAERARAVEALLDAVFDQLRPGVEAWRATVAALQRVPHDALLVALLAVSRFPEFVVGSGAEAVLTAALADLEQLGADQAEDEAEAVTEYVSLVAPVLVGAAAGSVLTHAVFDAVDMAKLRAIAGTGSGDMVADVRAAVSSSVRRTVVTEAHRAMNTGALAAIRTYTGVDAVWRTEAGPCPVCADLAGRLIDVETGIPPAHPNCRCSTVPWPAERRVPAVVGSA